MELPMTALRQRMTEDMQIRNLSANTQASYVLQVSQFARHFSRSPTELSAEDVRTYQVYLMNEKKLSPSSITIAISAIRFLYKVTLKKDWNLDEAIPTCKKPLKLPTILSPDEVRRFLGCVTSIKHRAILTTCYGAGLRITEAVQLKPAAIDSKRMVLKVEQGKGQKDRYVMLSPQLLDTLRNYWRLAHPTDWLFPGDQPGRPITRFVRLSAPANRRDGSLASASRSRLILCATPSPSTCWNPAPISAPSNFCWDTEAWPPRPAIFGSPPARSAPPPVRWTCCRDLPSSRQSPRRHRISERCVNDAAQAGSGGRVPPLRRQLP
jgi:integrase/recombinase XerD